MSGTDLLDATEIVSEGFQEIPVDKVTVNPYQPRRQFSSEELEELAESIKSVGIIHPPVVRYSFEEDCFELISGERRFRAAQIAGLTKLPVLVKVTTQKQSAQAALIENVQRIDLNPMEIADALKRLSQEYKMSQDELAKKIGKKRSTIANYMRLKYLPERIQNSLSVDEISMGHAKVILSLENEEQQLLLHDLIIRKGLTVRQAEDESKKINTKSKKRALVYRTRDFYVEQLEEQLKELLATKVVIEEQGKKGKKGKIIIDYYNLDDLDRLLEIFGAQEQL